MTPDELLGAARDILHEPARTPSGWPRMVALLTRQALEKALDEFWDSRPVTVGLSSCTRTSQLACLPFYLDASVALKANYVWAALSGACHYDAYELAPTAGELSSWLAAVAEVVESIDRACLGSNGHRVQIH